MVSALSGAVFGVLSVAIGSYYSGYWTLPPGLTGFIDLREETDQFNLASRQLGDFLSNRFSVGDIDSLSVAVVSTDGLLFEGNYGVMGGNESQSSPPTTSDPTYRIASVSKLFNVLEGHILAEKGILSWEDPVEKFIPSFTHNSGSLTAPKESMASKTSSITLFQLATHMSGLGRDWPPLRTGPPPTNGLSFPEDTALLRSITDNSLISPPSTWPIYSNTGTGLLGLALLEADRAARNATESLSYADLLQRDIFDPLGMTGSHFLTSEANKKLIVVPSLAPEVADQDFLDAMNPAGGQFSSLRDCATLAQTLLNPEHPKSLITKATMDKWLRPVYSFEEDNWTKSGFIWEIIKAPQKASKDLLEASVGAMAGYHAALAIHPGTSYGVVVLLGGHFPDSLIVFADTSIERCAGEWFAKDRSSTASVAVVRGTLYIDRLIVDTPIYQRFGVGGIDTCNIGLPYYNGKKHFGCYAYWAGLDVWGMRNGAAFNSIFFSGNDSDRRLHVPALDVEMVRLGA
ncbi:beta-lactamase/transpeptidase-like protein [Mycena latifolia]|nr:beta-lactamase/transpeptidase-like protein [Mycena latifolia]